MEYVKKPILMKDYDEIKIYTKKAFENIGSESYRQRLVYRLLNTATVNNQKDFFSSLLRALNSRKDDENVKRLSRKLEWLFPLSPANFEKVAYSIIMGIMAVRGE
ncbi:MAG: hypothetical protein QXL14_00210 [Candidatus Aenigmatarchaeota archaeon]|nr:hypothetical protein [Methanothermobacter sp.]